MNWDIDVAIPTKNSEDVIEESLIHLKRAINNSHFGVSRVLLEHAGDDSTPEIVRNTVECDVTVEFSDSKFGYDDVWSRIALSRTSTPLYCATTRGKYGRIHLLYTGCRW